jgi:hypothetical protein
MVFDGVPYPVVEFEDVDAAVLKDVRALIDTARGDASIHGILYGPFSRVMVMLFVCDTKVPFVIASRDSKTTLSRATWATISGVHAPPPCLIDIQGVQVEVGVSVGTAANVLGADYLAAAKVSLAIDYATLSGVLLELNRMSTARMTWMTVVVRCCCN